VENERPRVVIVGAATRDVFPDRSADGGAVRYGARVVEAFGARAGLVVLDDAPSVDDAAFASHALHHVEGGSRLTFGIRATGDRRQMRVLSRPSTALKLEDVPVGWRTPELLVLGPLLQDDIDVASFVDARPSWTLVIAQGLLRAIASGGAVGPLGRVPEVLRRFARPRVIVAVSAEETAGWAASDVDGLAERGAIVLLTEGSAGAEVITASERFHVKPPTATAVDTTGAGDVFATAFACALALGTVESLREAGRLAAQFAAASVETQGPAPLPDVQAIMARAGVAAHAVDAGAA